MCVSVCVCYLSCWVLPAMRGLSKVPDEEDAEGGWNEDAAVPRYPELRAAQIGFSVCTRANMYQYRYIFIVHVSP